MMLLAGTVRASCLCIFFFPLAALATVVPQYHQIAPGVNMPTVNCGGGPWRGAASESNFSEFLRLACPQSGTPGPCAGGLDTALTYGVPTQTSVGDAIRKSHLPRERVFVTTKIPCCPYDGRDCLANYSASGVPAEFEADLTQLGLEQVDLMLLHWPCKTLDETVATYKQMEKMLVQKKARAIGVSNFNADFMKQFLSSDIKIKPAVNQCGYSIGAHNRSDAGGDDATRIYCQSQGIAYQAYSPLGGLSGIDVLGDKDVNAIALAHKVSAAQVALRWVAQQGALFVTAGSKSEYLQEDLDIYGFELSSSEMDLLSSK